MKIENVSKYRLQLLQRLSELKTATANIKIELADAAESQTNFLQDYVDYAKEQSDLHARLKIYERYVQERLKILCALERIENGSFGDCNECGEMIAAKRLFVQPSAALCVECQGTKEDRTRSTAAPAQRTHLGSLLESFCRPARVA